MIAPARDMSGDTSRGGKLIGQAAMVAVAAGLTVLAICDPYSLPLLLFVIVVLVAGICWSLFLRGPFRIVMPAVATVAFAAMAMPFVRTMKEMKETQRPAEPNYYALPTDEEGRRVLPVRSVPGVPGWQVRLVSAVNDTAPSWSDIKTCAWRIRWRGNETTPETDGTCFHVPFTQPCLGEWYDTDVAPDGEPFEISYDVNERTRPVLEHLKVQVTYPFTYGNDLAMGAMGRAFTAIAELVLGGLAVVGAMATVVAVVRTRTARNS